MAATNKVPPPDRALSRKAAIIGVGETDYGDDYRAQRAKAEGYDPPTPDGLATTAFERALADSGLRRSDIDGLAFSFLYGGPDGDELAGLLGLAPRHIMPVHGIMAGPLPQVAAAIAEGKANTIAMVYAVCPRVIRRVFGGNYSGASERTPASYYYHNPWGWSSQGAHWGMCWQYYRNRFGRAEDELAEVAIQLRSNAIAVPQAIMQKPITRDDYCAARFIMKPLRLLDMCLVNDGAVCLIVSRADRAQDSAKTPVAIAGWSESEAKANKLDALIRQQLRPQFADASAQAFAMAGLTPADVQHFEGYDTSTMHLINHIEGHGFAEPGTALDRFRDGDFAPGSKLPINTAGGMLSGAYMHGWNHVAEAVRQLRHEAGPRQTPGVQVAMTSLAQTSQVHPLILTRGTK